VDVVGQRHLGEPQGSHDDAGCLLDVLPVPQAEGDLAVKRRPVDDQVEVRLQLRRRQHGFHLDAGDRLELEVLRVGLLGDGDRLREAGEEVAFLQVREQLGE